AGGSPGRRDRSPSRPWLPPSAGAVAQPRGSLVGGAYRSSLDAVRDVRPLEVLEDRRERERREEGQGADDQDHADEERSEERAVGRERPRARRDHLLLRQRAGDPEARDDHGEAAEEHDEPARAVPEVGVRVETREGAAVVPGARAVAVEDLGEA